MLREKLYKSVIRKHAISRIAIARWRHANNPFSIVRNHYIRMYHSALVSKNQFEACRKVVTRLVRRQRPKTKFTSASRFIYNFTRKTKNARMGRGKGSIAGTSYRAVVYSPLFLLKKVSSGRALRCGFDAQKKMSGRLCVVSKWPVTRSAPYVSSRRMCYVRCSNFIRDVAVASI